MARYSICAATTVAEKAEAKEEEKGAVRYVSCEAAAFSTQPMESGSSLLFFGSNCKRDSVAVCAFVEERLNAEDG